MDQIPPAFTSAALAFGSSIHEASAAFYQSVLEGDVLRPDQMLDVYRDAWRSKEGIKFFNGDSENLLIEKAGQILSMFHDSHDGTATVLGVEEFFELPLGGLPPFIGYIDLIEQSADGVVTIVDLKTASKKPAGSSAHSNLQLTAYSLGADALGFEPSSLNLRLDVITKTKSPELVKYETSRTEEDRRRFVKLLYQVWNGIEQGVWFPREDWHCSQCAWSKHCAEW